MRSRSAAACHGGCLRSTVPEGSAILYTEEWRGYTAVEAKLKTHHATVKHGRADDGNSTAPITKDVLIAKVKGLAPATLIEKRYAHINHFEKLLVDHGTRIVKVMLHISPEYQLEQFRDRLKTPSKQASLLERLHASV